MKLIYNTKTTGCIPYSLKNIYFVFLSFYVYVAVLREADPPSKQSYRLCMDQETENKRPRSTNALEP
jgi:hypothetical protein